jgi:hypothetical protein
MPDNIGSGLLTADIIAIALNVDPVECRSLPMTGVVRLRSLTRWTKFQFLVLKVPPDMECI